MCSKQFLKGMGSCHKTNETCDAYCHFRAPDDRLRDFSPQTQLTSQSFQDVW